MNILAEFANAQKKLEDARQLEGNMLEGYVLTIGYERAQIATCTALQHCAGPLARGAFLLAISQNSPDHAILLRVQGVAPSPLASLENMTNYEMAKRGIPALDCYTATDMSWTALDCDILGTFYYRRERVFFGGDVCRLDCANAYRVYAPGILLPLVLTGQYGVSDDGSGILRAREFDPINRDLVSRADFRRIGFYRPTEVAFLLNQSPCYLYLDDLIGHRVALFGKTRSGKSNVLKCIAASLIECNRSCQNLGQLIIDTNGEYCHDNPQDGRCLFTRYSSECVAYSVNASAPSGALNVLRFNFYVTPDLAMSIFADQLSHVGSATYVTSFLAASVPSLAEVNAMPPGRDYTRAVRRIQMLWATLWMAGFPADEKDLSRKLRTGRGRSPFDPGFPKEIRDKLYNGKIPAAPNSLQSLTDELKQLAAYCDNHPKDQLKSSGGNPLLDSDDMAILRFAFPQSGRSGPAALRGCKSLHCLTATNFLGEIPTLLERHKTVIVDVSNASPAMVRFLVDKICSAVFHRQEALFTNNKLGKNYVQLYIEEAHNYFPATAKDVTDVYSRIAKEGAKFHIGIVYSTQSPSTISGELLSQTENFVVANLDSTVETDALSKRCAAYKGTAESILRTRTPGYVHLLTASQRYPIPVQIVSFSDF